MNENENKKSVVRITEGNPNETADVLKNDTQNNKEKLKKPLIFSLMAIVFAGCMYLIFKPSEDKKKLKNIGLNDAVPQATGAEMPDDKGKAYELEILEQKDQEKRNALTTLADYWNTDSLQRMEEEMPEEEDNYDFGSGNNNQRSGNSGLHSYRNMQKHFGFILSGRQFRNNGAPQATG